MALTNPSNIAISDIFYNFYANVVSVFARISWTNEESAPHFVKVNIGNISRDLPNGGSPFWERGGPSSYFLSKESTSISGAWLGLSYPENPSPTVSISVQLISDSDSSDTVEATLAVPIWDSAQFLSAPSFGTSQENGISFGSSLNIPSWSGPLPADWPSNLALRENFPAAQRPAGVVEFFQYKDGAIIRPAVHIARVNLQSKTAIFQNIKSNTTYLAQLTLRAPTLQEPPGTFLMLPRLIQTSHIFTTGELNLPDEDDPNASKTVVFGNPGWQNNGLAFNLGENVLVGLSSSPSTNNWFSTGLPSGLVIDESGVIKGRATPAGRFIASISAQAIGYAKSDPLQISFKINDAGGGVGGGGGNDGPDPQNRIPWIASRWDLIDLQILARTRVVQSTLIDRQSGIRVKVGDNINFAVFFIGSEDVPFELAPDRLRLTIRPADNLEGALVFESDNSPDAITAEPDPYYLLAAATTGRQRQIVQEWVEDSGKNDPLPCVADLDWTKDGQHFSSASFPVLLELDVTRP